MDTKANDATSWFDLPTTIKAAKDKLGSTQPKLSFDKTYPVESQMGMVPLTKPEPSTPIPSEPKLPHEFKVPIKK